MSKLMSAVTLAAVSGFAFASPAFAGYKVKTEMKQATVETTSMATEMPDAQSYVILADVETQVRGAVESGEFVAVEGPDGRIYYNKVMSIDELPDPTLDVRTIESYEVNHDGNTYVNKVVQDIN